VSTRWRVPLLRDGHAVERVVATSAGRARAAALALKEERRAHPGASVAPGGEPAKVPPPGRPVGSTTTGSDATKRVVFRVGSELRAALDARGARRGVSGDVEAKAIVTAALTRETAS
jgi:hypothetical protein